MPYPEPQSYTYLNARVSAQSNDISSVYISGIRNPSNRTIQVGTPVKGNRVIDEARPLPDIVHDRSITYLVATAAGEVAL